jgi:hypothetical protein
VRRVAWHRERLLILFAVKLSEETIVESPIDQLGLMVLKDFINTGGWNDYNYVNDARNAGYGRDALRGSLRPSLG